MIDVTLVTGGSRKEQTKRYPSVHPCGNRERDHGRAVANTHTNQLGQCAVGVFWVTLAGGG
jgi:hypothetical protein